ncbi:hypothetical protein ACI65C_011189 [Semiaphis heraclei]
MVDLANPNNDFEVVSPPGDTVTAMEFSPAASQKTFLVAGSWDNTVRCWEVQEIGQTIPKSIRSMTMPIYDICWNGDGTKVFTASYNNQVECWDLEGNRTMLVGTHDGPVRTCHWVVSSPYTCVMTGSLDGTLKFWDLRSPNPLLKINVGEKVYCADVIYPHVVVGTETNNIITYNVAVKKMLASHSVSS